MMIKVKLVVRVIKNDEVVGGYVQNIELPFVPTVGMKFKQGISTRMWETLDNNEINPSVQQVICDLDEQCIIALFEISDFLASNFWIKLDYENLDNSSTEMKYFDYI